MKKTALRLLLLPAFFFLPAHAATLALKDSGISVTTGTAQLKATFAWPHLLGANQKESHKIFDKTLAGDSATLKYEGGGSAVVTIRPDGTIRIEFADIPYDVKFFATSTLLSFGLSDGGKWRFDDRPWQPFPAEKPDKPHLFQNNSRRFAMSAADGGSLEFSLPAYSYNELLDNRAWNWKTFAWKIKVPFNPDSPVAEIKVDSAAPDTATPPAPTVDPFGQSNKRDWPGKVKSVAELKADVAADAAYYASFSPPATDRYGGYPGTGEKLGLKKTGFFHVQQAGGRWHLVDPDGNAFFQIGAGGFAIPFWTYVAGRKSTYEWLPPMDGDYQTAYRDGKEKDDFSFYCANWIRKYGKPFDQEEFTAEMIRRVRAWGFNSTGYFSGKVHQAYADHDFPYVAGVGTTAFPPVPGLARAFDPFSEEGVQKFDGRLAVVLSKQVNNPLIVGYFMGNEPILEDIPRVVPALKGGQPCKERLVRMLQEKYGDIAVFNQAWKMQAKTFAELNTQGLPVTTPQAREDMKHYTELFVDRLYSVVASTFRKYDKNHLLIGNRLQYGTINDEMVCRVMARYLDVVSFNYYTYAFDNDFLRKIHGWTGKPMILSEFSWNAPDSGLGGVKDLENQEQRGLAYRNYIEQAAALGFVVGIEWYELLDEPVTGLWWGRYSGPHGNNGLIGVTDRPWKEMIKNVAKGNFDVRDIVLNGKKPFVYDHPLFTVSKGGSRVVRIPRATGPIKLDGSMEGWPGLPAELFGKNLVEGSNPGGISAAFKLCRDDKTFYFWMHVIDPTPMKNRQAGGALWQGDAVELFFGPEQTGETGPLLPGDRHVLLSAAADAQGKAAVYFVNQKVQPPCGLTAIPDVDGKGYTLEAAIPFSSLGFNPKDGDTLLFDIGLDDSADGLTRARQFMWNGTSRNSTERSGWGKAVFNP